MSRNVSLILVILIIAALAAGSFFLLRESTDDPGFDFDPTPGRTPGVAPPKPAPEPKPTPKPAALDDAPKPPPKPTAPIPIEMTWYGTAAAAGAATGDRANRAPFPELPKTPVFERKIVVHCAPAVAAPVQMEVRYGSPWGEFKFSPEADGKTFILRDRYGSRCPRALRFYFDERKLRFVERWLEPGDRPASFYIGPPGTISGTLLGPDGNPSPGVAICNGITARSDNNGRFTLEGIHGGNAVVRTAAIGLAATRHILQAPGGPYSLRLPKGVDLELTIARSDDRTPPEKFWACAIPASGGSDDPQFTAEDFYNRETLGGAVALKFGYIRAGWNGMVVIWHPVFATQIVPFENLTTTHRTIQPDTRRVLTGRVLDAKTKQAVPKTVLVTSAESTTVYDALVANNYLRAPRDKWRQPVPYLGRPLVHKELAEDGGFKLYVDPLIRRLDVAVHADGYVPVMLRNILVDDGTKPLEFALERDSPERRAVIELRFAETVDIDWKRVAITPRFAGFGEIDEVARTITFRHIPPGEYGFRFPSFPALGEIDVTVGPGKTERVPLE